MGRRLLDSSYLDIGGREVPLELRYDTRARRIILRVDSSTGVVTVTSPYARRLGPARAFAHSHVDWIAKQLNNALEPVPFAPGYQIPLRGKVHEIDHQPFQRGGVWCETGVGDALGVIRVSGQDAHIARRITDWLKREARRDIVEQVQVHADTLGVKPRRISLRDPITRWGSCSHEGMLSFSWRLILAPSYVLDYVAAHEVAHIVELNHGKCFWRTVGMLINDVERAVTWLDDEGPHLRRYGMIPPPPTRDATNASALPSKAE